MFIEDRFHQGHSISLDTAGQLHIYIFCYCGNMNKILASTDKLSPSTSCAGGGAQIPYHGKYVAIWKPIVCRHMCVQCMYMYMFTHICIVLCVHICPYMCFYISVEIRNLYHLPFFFKKFVFISFLEIFIFGWK